MRLFLSDTFFDQMIRLPRNVQQKVIDFQRKFRVDSTQSSIHLEPIPEFKNNTLRTARLSDGYRAVLGLMDGESYNLLYVAQHDDAYRWAKNKTFVWNAHTQSCQLIPLEEKEPEIVDSSTSSVSLQTAGIFGSNITDEQLLMIGVPQNLISRVRMIVDLNDLDKMEYLLPHDAFENLFALFDGGEIDIIINEIKEGFAADGTDVLLSGNNRRRFVELTGDDELERIIDQDLDKWQIFLHPSQRHLVEGEYRGSVKVSGSAGTGKTVAAMHRLKHLCKRSDARVLFTTYTTTLKCNLKGVLSKMAIPDDRYDLNNIDSVVVGIAKKNGIMPSGYSILDYGGDDKALQLWKEVKDYIKTSFDEEFLYGEYVDVILYYDNKNIEEYLRQPRNGRAKAISRKERLEIWSLKTKYEELKNAKKKMDRLELFNLTARYLNENNIRPYTNIIVDEFQDFSNPELRFLRALVSEGQNDMFFVGDPFQRIYGGRKLNFSAAGINIRGNRSRKLKVNYRTTEEIKRVAVSIVKGEKYDDMDGGVENNNGYISIMHGVKPHYEVVGSPSEECKKVLEWLEMCKKDGVPEREICIAAPSKRIIKDVQNVLHQQRIDYCLLKPEEGMVSEDGGCRLCTFHSIKGLEFNVVILVGVNEKNVPSCIDQTSPLQSKSIVEQKEYLAERRSLLYVAITRAQQRVYICGSGEPCEIAMQSIG